MTKRTTTKKTKPARYTSKEYRAFESYLSAKHFSALMGEDLYNQMNNIGFAARFLALSNGRPRREQKPRLTAARDAYEAERRPYRRHERYVVPEDFKAYDWMLK